jgi:hypothetical protein
MTSLYEDFEKAWRKRHFVPTPNPEYKPGAQEEADKNRAREKGEKDFKQRLKDKLSNKGYLTGAEGTKDDTDYSVKDRLTPGQKGALHRKEKKMQEYQVMPQKPDFDGTTKTTLYPPSKTEALEADKVPLNERPNNASTYHVDEADKAHGNKPVSASDRRAEIMKSVPNNYDVKAHKAALQERKDISENAKVSSKKDPYTSGIIKELRGLSGWVSLVRAIKSGKTEYKAGSNTYTITPELTDKIKQAVEDLKNVNPEALTDAEKNVLDEWDSDILKDKLKDFTKQKKEHDKAYEKALDEAAGSGRHSVKVDVNASGVWDGFRVVKGGKTAGYAMRIETDKDGNKIAVGYGLFGDNQPDTDLGPVFTRSMSDFNNNRDAALKFFQTAMESNTGEVKGSYAPVYAKVNAANKDFAKNNTLNKDYSKVLALYGSKKLYDIMRENDFVVDEETNKVVPIEDVPDGHSWIRPYATDEEKENLRTGRTLKAGLVDLNAAAQKRLDTRFKDQLGPNEHVVLESHTARNIGANSNGAVKLVKEYYAVDNDDPSKKRLLKKLKDQQIVGSIGTSAPGTLGEGRDFENDPYNLAATAKKQAIVDSLSDEDKTLARFASYLRHTKYR